MRELTLEELELIAGAYGTTQVITITGTRPPSSSPPITTPPVTTPPPTGGGGSPPPPTCETALPNGDRVDSATIIAHEGGMLTTGYILNPTNFPNSGLTISAGVDLGSRTAADLTNSGISQAGIDSLTPYLGQHGQTAQNTVNSIGHLPEISTTDAQTLFNYVYNGIEGTVSSAFNAASTTGIQFSQLPGAAQQVIMDVGFISPNLASAAPNFWGDVTTGNWQAAANELNNWTASGSDSRHQDLAQELQAAIDRSELPASTSSGVCN